MITKEDIAKVQTKAKQLKALVIGDTMLDKYIYGSVERISPEAPVPILSHQSTELKAGGAANVALNLAAWGCDVSLVGLAGDDPNGEILKSVLSRFAIKHDLLTDADRPTTVKTRVVASSHHLLRIDEESTNYPEGDAEQKMVHRVLEILKAYRPDLIILQDYNKGFLTRNLIKEVITTGKSLESFIAVDPKERHFFDYGRADLLKPNLREAEHAAKMHLSISDLPSLTKGWREDMKVGTIAITLGSNGIYLQNEKSEAHVKPDRAIDVVDVCGAGDAVICSLALSLLADFGLQESGDLANLSGAYVCSHSGVVAARPDEIMTWI